MHSRPLLLLLGMLAIGEAKPPCKSGAAIPSSIGAEAPSLTVEPTALLSPDPTALMSPDPTAQSAAQSVAQSVAQSAAQSTPQPTTQPASNNWNFDDSATSMSPWYRRIINAVNVSIDTEQHQSGTNSIKFTFPGGKSRLAAHISRPLDVTQIKADVPIEISAWALYESASQTKGCQGFILLCSGNGNNFIRTSDKFTKKPWEGTVKNWQQGTATCIFTQDQLNRGGRLDMNIGFVCHPDNEAWIDTASVNYRAPPRTTSIRPTPRLTTEVNPLKQTPPPVVEPAHDD